MATRCSRSTTRSAGSRIRRSASISRAVTICRCPRPPSSKPSPAARTPPPARSRSPPPHRCSRASSHQAQSSRSISSAPRPASASPALSASTPISSPRRRLCPISTRFSRSAIPSASPPTAGNGRVSPLAAEAWKLLEREGALTTMELRSQLGREVTEAAVLRSLAELWHTMRVVPVPAENPPEGAHWELLSARHRRELNIGSTQSQTTALSILVSFYLQSAVAATAEEVEIFLSPRRLALAHPRRRPRPLHHAPARILFPRRRRAVLRRGHHCPRSRKRRRPRQRRAAQLDASRRCRSSRGRRIGAERAEL